MKKKLSVSLLIFICNVALFGQTTIKMENFVGVTAPNLPTNVNTSSLDWFTDPNTSNGGGVPVCNVAGTSSLNVLAATCTGAVEEVVFGPFDATFFTSIKVSWNGYRTITGGAAPTLSLSFSTGGTYTNIPFTDIATDDAWHALTAVNIPAGANNSPSLTIKLSYDVSTGTNGSFIAFDDWLLQGTQSPVYYWNGSGFLNDVNSWSLNTNGVGVPHPTDFTTASQLFNIVNGTAATISGTWSVSGSGSKVIVGDGLTWNPNFTVPSGFVFSVASGSMLAVSNNATLTLQNTTLPTTSGATFTTGSTVNYAQSAAVNIINTPHSNLTISGGANKNQASSLTINGILNLIGSNLQVSNSSLNTLTINGTVSGSGALQTTANSKISIGGTGAIGTITFSSTTAPIVCRSLVINRAASGSLVLGSNLQINNVLSLTSGIININGRTLTTTTTTALSLLGSFAGSSSSSLLLGASSISGSLNMDVSNNNLNVLTLNASGLTLILGNVLNILDSVKVSAGTITTGGNLTLKSTNALKARVAEIPAGAAVTGNINVETFYNAGFAGWETVGPAGVSGLSVTNWDGGSGSSTGIGMTCNGCINDEYSAGGSYFVSIQSDPTGTGVYTDLVASSPLTPAQGYWMFVGNSLTTAIDVTQTTSGSIVTGPQSMASSFVSNPYPSPISADRLKSHNASMGAVYVWDPDAGAFVSYNSGVGSPKLANGGIAMGQGFYIDGSTLSFIESDKVSRNTSANALLKTSTTNVGTVFQLNINGTNSDVDNTYFRFHQNGTTNYDGDLDAYKKFATPGYVGYPGAYNKYTTISSKFNNIDYSINSLPYPTTADMVMPILVKVMSTGSYTISATDLANLPINSCVTLKDKLLNIDHDLKTGSYVCNISDTTSTARFELTVCSNLTTGLDNKSANVTQHNTIISQDVNGAFVKTNFTSSTKATISAYNVMGQKIMLDKEIEGTDMTTHLDLNVHNQVVIIRVTSAKENTTKKIFIN